jgi:hypothetical protein
LNGPFCGVEVYGVVQDRLLHDNYLPSRLLEAVNRHGVLLFSEMKLEDPGSGYRTGSVR